MIVDIMSVAMAAVGVSKTTLSLTCILFCAYCHVQRCPFSSYSSPFTSHLCIFEFQAYLSLPQSTHLAIGLHLIWFMYCIYVVYHYTSTVWCTIYVYMYVPVLSIHTYVRKYIHTVFILYPALYQDSLSRI